MITLGGHIWVSETEGRDLASTPTDCGYTNVCSKLWFCFMMCCTWSEIGICGLLAEDEIVTS